MVAAVAIPAAQQLLAWRKEKSAAVKEARELALQRLDQAHGGRPVIGKFSARDIRDLATAANTPLVIIPTTLLVFGMIGRNPRASAFVEEGIAAIARGVGQGFAAASSGVVRGLWEGIVYDPSLERKGALEAGFGAIWDVGAKAAEIVTGGASGARFGKGISQPIGSGPAWGGGY